MNLLKYTTFVVFLFSSFQAFSGSDLCKNGYITDIDIGYVEGLRHGNNSGNAIDVKIDGGWIPANNAYNLDDEKGKALYSMLKTAMIMRLKVRLYDSHGTRCDDFDRVWITRD